MQMLLFAVLKGAAAASLYINTDFDSISRRQSQGEMRGRGRRGAGGRGRGGEGRILVRA